MGRMQILGCNGLLIAKKRPDPFFFSEKYVDYYHRHRNHQGLKNLRIDPPPDEPIAGSIHCEHELGGLLKHYHRRAA